MSPRPGGKDMEKYKMEIEMDEKKLYDEGYDVAEINSKIDSVFEAVDIKKVKVGRYEGTGTKDDFGRFGGATLLLNRQEWFLPYVKKWLFHSDAGIEDFANHYRKQKG
jgi:hypothetical protein